MARFATEALDVTMRIARGVVVRDQNVRLLFTRIKAPVLAEVLAQLLDRRQVALPAVATFVKQKVRVKSPDEAARTFVDRVRAVFEGREAFLADGPRGVAEFRWVAADAARLAQGADAIPVGDVPQLRRRLERYFLTKKLEARKKLPGSAKDHPSPASRKRHQDAFLAMAPAIEDATKALDRDVDGLLARGLLTVLTIAVQQYQKLMDEHAVLDFAGMLDRAVTLLERQEEFARSRLKLQARYHHLLVDEFQDTSRQQWRLVDMLIDAWGEGEGIADGATSIFIVGDRKQSIYRFRHAEVALLAAGARLQQRHLRVAKSIDRLLAVADDEDGRRRRRRPRLLPTRRSACRPGATAAGWCPGTHPRAGGDSAPATSAGCARTLPAFEQRDRTIEHAGEIEHGMFIHQLLILLRRRWSTP